MIEKNSGKPYMNVIFGNFYSPGYDDPDFVDETMELIKNLGYNSVMFDTKDWEDFRERYKTGERSQYVKMQEYMGQSALKHGLTYNFLVLYLNGDNLYPHIRFSPPVFGEEVVTIDQKGGKWYKYWSDTARETMAEHVDQILQMYGEGCTTCRLGQKQVLPTCTMWDPIAAPSFDQDGIERYQKFLKEKYKNNISLFNERYDLDIDDFKQLKPEDYWYSVIYGEGSCYTGEDIRKRTKKFWIWKDNMSWKIEELRLYFKDMQTRLKKDHPELFLCPDLSQWGYFLNVYSQKQCDSDNPDYSELWDTAMRGIDMYAISPYVDSCHFITVPARPDASPDAYVTSCQHSMMRVMNEGKECIGGIYWGRYIYRDLYAFLTPEEIVGTMTACGVDGYTSYGMNGLDDGGVLNRMEDDFLDSLRRGNTWCAEVIPKRGKSKFKEIAILFPSEMSDYEPFDVENNEIRRLDMLGWYDICCDLGYQTDVISYHDILENKLNDYKMLIVPSNDCYFAEEHTDMEKMIREWVTNGGVVLHGPDCGLSKNCFGIQGIPCEKTPYIYQKPVIPQGCEFQRYETGRCISAYADDAGKCIVMQEIEKGKVISCGVQLGASYVAKNIPHVPYEQRNKEMYPIIQARSTLLEDLLGVCGKPVSGICERGIEAGVFETGMVLVNHRSTPYEIGNLKGNRKFTNPVNDTVLLPHSAVWIERE